MGIYLKGDMVLSATLGLMVGNFIFQGVCTHRYGLAFERSIFQITAILVLVFVSRFND